MASLVLEVIRSDDFVVAMRMQVEPVFQP